MKEELNAIKKSKELSKIIFEITELSPKKFRFSLISKMQNLSLDIVSNLYMANDIYVNSRLISDFEKTIAVIQKRNNYSNAVEWSFYKNKLYQLKLLKAQKLDERVTKRLDYSYKAMTHTKQLDFLVCISAQVGCITLKQQERAAKLLYEVRNLIGAFIRGDKKRFNY